MPKIAYIEKRMGSDRLAVVDQANEILDEYAEQGYDLTLRQLYYQFVARGLLPNNIQSYKRLGDIINDARLCGLIDWARIEDRTRNLVRQSSWTSIEGMIESAADSYHIDRWSTQPYRVEVWFEKEALSGIFERVCTELDVPYFACRGYVSQSEAWRAAMRLTKYRRDNQSTVILHFGDHDPSGVDMTRDIGARLETFRVPVTIERLALNMDQVEQYNPPPNPAKTTDARAKGYIKIYGNESWELDALDPTTLANLVRESVDQFRDMDRWNEVAELERDHRAILLATKAAWPDVDGYLREEQTELIESCRNQLEEE